jgi:hypothetical protein
MSAGSFQTRGRGEVNLSFFEYSNNKEYLVKPDHEKRWYVYAISFL